MSKEQIKVEEILNKCFEDIEKISEKSCFALSCYKGKGKSAKMNATMILVDDVKTSEFKSIGKTDMIYFWEELK